VVMRETNWSRYAQVYDEVIRPFPEYQKLLDLVVDQIGDAQNCLDVGAGTGNATIRMLERAQEKGIDRHVTVVEKNEEMLRQLEKKLQAKPEFRSKVSIVKGDIVSYLKRMELAEGKFDACVMLNVLFALDDPVACLKEIYQTLDSGGVLSLST